MYLSNLSTTTYTLLTFSFLNIHFPCLRVQLWGRCWRPRRKSGLYTASSGLWRHAHLPEALSRYRGKKVVRVWQNMLKTGLSQPQKWFVATEHSWYYLYCQGESGDVVIFCTDKTSPLQLLYRYNQETLWKPLETSWAWFVKRPCFQKTKNIYSNLPDNVFIIVI